MTPRLCHALFIVCGLSSKLTGVNALRLNKLIPERNGATSEEIKLFHDQLGNGLTGDFGTHEASILDATGLGDVIRRRLEDGSQKHVIYFLGDSMIRNQFQALCYVLWNNGTIPEHPVLASAYACSDQNKAVTAVLFHRTIDNNFDPNIIEIAREKKLPDPTLIALNSALWLLNLGERPVLGASLSRILKIKTYETDLRIALKRYSHQAPSAKLAVETGHAICRSAAEDIGKEFDRTDDDAAEVCVNKVYNRNDNMNMSKEEVHKVCWESRFNNRGMENLIQRMKKVVSENEEGGVKLVDMYQLTSGNCDKVDWLGVHYNTMLFDELLLLLDTMAI